MEKQVIALAVMEVLVEVKVKVVEEGVLLETEKMLQHPEREMEVREYQRQYQASLQITEEVAVVVLGLGELLELVLMVEEMVLLKVPVLIRCLEQEAVVAVEVEVARIQEAL
jgi:alpha-tubulin suppressor-like RCC1 family protein